MIYGLKPFNSAELRQYLDIISEQAPAPLDASKDPLLGTFAQINGTLKNIASLRQGGPNTFAHIDPKVEQQVAKMQQDLATVKQQLLQKGYSEQQLAQFLTPPPAAPGINKATLTPADDLEETQDHSHEVKEDQVGLSEAEKLRTIINKLT